jgi:CRP-like cAMP-binding protein
LIQIRKGEIKVETKIENKKVESFLKRGNFIGEISFLSKKKFESNLFASEDTELIYFNKSDLDILFVRSPALSSHFFFFLSQLIFKKISSFIKNNLKL